MEPTFNILVVDDIPLMRTMLVKYIQTLGKKIFGGMHPPMQARVTEAPNGRVALEKLRDGPIDLVFLDLMMPEMDGLTFLHEKGLLPECERIPVIVCSAVGEDNIVNRARRLGAASYVVKPFKLAALETEFRDVVQRRFQDSAESR